MVLIGDDNVSKTTDIRLRNTFIYQVFVRNYSEAGTFKEVEKDLDRIKELGVDYVYLLPIHEIGQIDRKGELGSPYAIKDYYSINHEYGNLEDFESLVQAVHNKGMKVMMDVVFNHTSPDSLLIKEHPEYFYRNKEGEFANRVGDWWDITDFDYTKDKGLWRYLIDNLLYWTKKGVDGFRWDVASFLPMEFLEQAHEEVLDLNPDVLFLSESVHGHFLRYIRNQGFECLSESEIYQVFDMAYDYDVHDYFLEYVKGNASLNTYLKEVVRQDEIYPKNYIKMKNLENHDNLRLAGLVKGDPVKVDAWTSFLFFTKGATMIYAGQEKSADHTPTLFDKDTVDWSGRDLSLLIRKLSDLSHQEIFAKGVYDIHLLDQEVICASYTYEGKELFGVFNVGHIQEEIKLPMDDGVYTNLLTSKTFEIKDGVLKNTLEPLILSKES
jgi:glycosidase